MINQKIKIKKLQLLFFVSVKLTRNGDKDKYKYICFSIGFDLHAACLLPDSSIEKMTLFLELILAHLYILRIKEYISKFLVKDQKLDKD